MDVMPQSKTPFDLVSARRRIRLMTLALAVALAAVLGLRHYSRMVPEAEKKQVKWEETEILEKEPPAAPEPTDDDVPTLDESRVQSNMEYLADPGILKEVEDRTNRFEMAALYVLLHRSRNLTPAKAREKVDKSIDPRSLMTEPEKARGRLVYIEGQLSKINHTPLQANATEITEVWRVKIVDLPTDPRCSYTYYIYLIDEPKNIATGEMVRLYAYFIKLWKFTDKKGKEHVVPYLIGKQIDPVDYTTDPWILERTVHDETLSPNQKGLLYLANKVKQMTPEQLRAAVDPEIHWMQLELAPKRHRGVAVHCQGTLQRLRRVELEINDEYGAKLGVRHLYSGFILIDHRRAFTVYVLNEPTDIRERSYVGVDGLFLHKWSFDNKAGDRMTSPVLLGLEMKPVEQPVSPLYWVIPGAIAAVLVVLGILAVVEMRHSRQAQKEAHSRRMRKTSVKRNAEGDGDATGAP